MPSVLIIFLFLVSSCSTRINLAGKYPIRSKSEITSIKFVPQEKHQCGPAALSMMISHLGVTADTNKISEMVFTPDKEGSFQTDMIAAVRRHKLLPLMIKNLANLLTEIDSDHPVLILQNLGLSWIPRWHYAVVVGYDLETSEIILHSGIRSYLRLGLYTFMKTWDRSKNWGLMILRPGDLSKTATADELVSAIAHLETMSFSEEAKLGYESVLRKYPGSFGALIGLGNIYYNKNAFKKSVEVLKRAVSVAPQLAEVWHNYALALKADGQLTLARSAAQKAVILCNDHLLPIYNSNLSDLLK